MRVPAHTNALPSPGGAVASPAQAHVTQFPSPLVPDAAAWGNSNCGPASVLIAATLLGLSIPGVLDPRSQAGIDEVRRQATGRIDQDEATTKEQQERVLVAAGATTVRTRSLDRALAAVREGAVLVVGGDRAHPAWPGTPLDDAAEGARLVVAGGPVRVDAGRLLPLGHVEKPHAAVVSGWQPELDRYVLNDPALPAPVLVSRQQLEAFTQVGRKAAGHMRREAIVAWRR